MYRHQSLNDQRIDFDTYAMVLAKVASLRSGCNSRANGAIIVIDRQIISTGYNGPLPGQPHCTDKGSDFCLRRAMNIPDYDKYNYCPSSHAEANAIAQAAKHGISIDGASMYCTLSPCVICAKSIVIAGIKAVYFETMYESKNEERDALWFNLLEKAGVGIQQLVIDYKVLTPIILSRILQISSVRCMEATT